MVKNMVFKKSWIIPNSLVSSLGGFQENNIYKCCNSCFSDIFLLPPFFPSIPPVLSFLYEKCTIKLQCYRRICFLFLHIQITPESHLFSSFPIFRNKTSERDGFEQWFVWVFCCCLFLSGMTVLCSLVEQLI